MIRTTLNLHESVHIDNQPDRGEITFTSGDHGEIVTTLSYADDVGLHSLITSLVLAVSREHGYAHRGLQQKVDKRVLQLIEEIRVEELENK